MRRTANRMPLFVIAACIVLTLILAPWTVKMISFYFDYLDWAIKL